MLSTSFPALSFLFLRRSRLRIEPTLPHRNRPVLAAARPGVHAGRRSPGVDDRGTGPRHGGARRRRTCAARRPWGDLRGRTVTRGRSSRLADSCACSHDSRVRLCGVHGSVGRGSKRRPRRVRQSGLCLDRRGRCCSGIDESASHRIDPRGAPHHGRDRGVVILPQLLASLGILFTTAGVGRAIAKVAGIVVPDGSPLGAILACSISIVAFTFVMGNSFAALPVIVAGLAVPLLIQGFGADPAITGVLLLTCASCGTLCTPMAANFNMVPAALLEMRDRYGVIRFQAPFAAAMFVVHVMLLWVLAS